MPISLRALQEEHHQLPRSDRSEKIRTILVVDDEESVRKITAAILVNGGYAVQTAVDGQEGADLFRQTPEEIDLILTDWLMPCKSGLDLLREVLAVKPDMPVVVMSGYPAPGEVKLHGIAFLAKPFSGRTLLTTIAAGLHSAAP